MQFAITPDPKEPRPFYPRVNAGVREFWADGHPGMIDNTDDWRNLGANLLWERGPASWYNERKNISTRFDCLVNPYNLSYVEEFVGRTAHRLPESAE